MKVQLRFKTPDVVENALEESVEHHTRGDAEQEIRLACVKWVEFGEYMTVEVDTEKGTCEVIPVRKAAQ